MYISQNNTFAYSATKAVRTFLPFCLFVTIAIISSFLKVVNINLLIVIGVFSILLGALIAHDGNRYWREIFGGMGSSTAMTATLLWLVVGIYGKLLVEGHLAEGLVWAISSLHINAALFVPLVFIFSGIFAISTGSGFGTICAMSMVLYPASVMLGNSPALTGGAILSGAALGDSISMVSDTAVIAAATQTETWDEGRETREVITSERSVDIGTSVKARLPLVALSAAIALVLYTLACNLSYTPSVEAAYHSDGGALGLLMLIPTALVVLLSMRGTNMFVTLFAGIILSVVLGLSFGLFTPYSLLHVRDGVAGGAIIDGVGGMTGICILLMVVVALSKLAISEDGMDIIGRGVNSLGVRSSRQSELLLFFMTATAGILIATVNTIANICVAPLVNTIGQRHHIPALRRTTLLATTICTFPFVLPYGGCVILLLQSVETAGCSGLHATDVLTTAFYPMALFIIVLLSCLYEKTDQTHS
ncbi:MAG: hypothetical protein IKN75_05480 [Prevotella sp.]|nr:hypothetical protein [Prevotella sp.]